MAKEQGRKRVVLMSLINKNKREEIKKAIEAGDTSKIGGMKKIQPLSENAAGAGAKQASEDIWAAAYNGDLQGIKDALAQGAEINSKSDVGKTPLMHAALSGEMGAIKLLIDSGSDLNARSREGDTAMMHACFRNHADAVKLLIDAGADVDARSHDGSTALINASSRGHLAAMKVLIDAGAELDLEAKEGQTALTEAIVFAKKNKTEAVKLLIDSGTDVNKGKWLYLNNLECACKKGEIGVVELLLEAGVDVYEGSERKSPRALAASIYRTDIVELIDKEVARRKQAGQK